MNIKIKAWRKLCARRRQRGWSERSFAYLRKLFPQGIPQRVETWQEFGWAIQGPQRKCTLLGQA